MMNSKDSEGWGNVLLEWNGICPEWKAPDLEWDLKPPEWDLMLAGWNVLDIDWKISPVIHQSSDRAENLIKWGLDDNDKGEYHYSISRDSGYFKRT